MMPHSNFGVRVRGCRFFPYFAKGGGGGRHIDPKMISILSLLAEAKASLQKNPFWRMLYRQGRRG